MTKVYVVVEVDTTYAGSTEGSVEIRGVWKDQAKAEIEAKETEYTDDLGLIKCYVHEFEVR